MSIKEQMDFTEFVGSIGRGAQYNLQMFNAQLIWNLNTQTLTGVASLFQYIKSQVRTATVYDGQEH